MDRQLRWALSSEVNVMEFDLTKAFVVNDA